jgi:hypothetical protein
MTRKAQPLCSVPRCGKPNHAKGYCSTHYNQLWRNGLIATEGSAKQFRIHNDDYDDHRGRNPNLNSVRTAHELENHRRALQQARKLYDLVTGHKGRLHYKREIDLIEAEIRRLEGRQPREAQRG